MAKIEKISWSSPFDTSEFINVSNSVGSCGVNRKDDVMVVQALFKFLLPINRGGNPPIGIPDSECPEPTGTFDKATARLIRKFQAKHYPRISRDGIIHPAKNGKYEWGCRRMWTIVSLNTMAIDTVIIKDLNSDGLYIQALINQFPQLENVLQRFIDI